MVWDKKKVIIVAGKYDPLLRGHVESIRKAKELGDYLIVITHPDEIVELARAKEGKIARCMIPLKDRVAVLGALKWVDEVVVSIDYDGESSQTLKLIRSRYPDVELIFARGGDRTPDRMPPKEIEVCREINCEIRYGIGDLLTSASEIVSKLGE